MFLNKFKIAAGWEVCDIWVFLLRSLSLHGGLGGRSQLSVTHGTVDLIDVLFSKTARRFNGNLKVNVLRSCDREGKRDLQRMQSGDSLSPWRGEG